MAIPLSNILQFDLVHFSNKPHIYKLAKQGKLLTSFTLVRVDHFLIAFTLSLSTYTLLEITIYYFGNYNITNEYDTFHEK